MVVSVTATLPVILLFILMGFYINKNNSMEAKGIDFYFGIERIAKPGQSAQDQAETFGRIF